MPNKLKESPCFSVSSISSSDSAYSSGDSLSEFRRVSRSTDTLSPDLSAYFRCPVRSYGEFSLPQKIPEPEVPEWIRKESRRRSSTFLNEPFARRRANSAGEKLLHFFHLGGEARRASVNAEKKKAIVDEWMQLDAAELLGKRTDKSGFRKRAATTGSAGKDVLNALLRFRSPSRDRKRESIPEATVDELITTMSQAPVAAVFTSEPPLLKCPEEPASRPRTPTIWDQQLQNACAANTAAAKMDDFWICHTPRPHDQNNYRDDGGLGETAPTAVGDHSHDGVDVYKQKDVKLNKPLHKICDGVFVSGGEFFMPMIDNNPREGVGSTGKSTGNVLKEEKVPAQQKFEEVPEQKKMERDLLVFTDNPRPLIECLRIAASTVYTRVKTFTQLYDIPADHRLRKLVQLVRLVVFGAYRQVDGEEKHAH